MSHSFPIVVSTGTCLPQTHFTNDEILSMSPPRNPKGDLIPPEWIEKYFGIQSRVFDYDLELGRKRTQEEGGLYDPDFAINAGNEALEKAGIDRDEVGTLIHVSPTADTLHFQSHIPDIVNGLGLSNDVHAVHLNLGCASMPVAFTEVLGHLLRDPKKHVLVVATQCTSGVAHSNQMLERYTRSSNPWAWLGYAVFSDAGGAILFRMSDPSEKRGLVRTWYRSMMDEWIIQHRVGGSRQPVSHENLDDMVYEVNAQFVGKYFAPIMVELFERLQQEWETYVQPVVQQPFSMDVVKRWYFHQANLVKINEAVSQLNLPKDRVPTNVQDLGNTSAPSTLILLDQDLQSGKVQPGDVVVFLVVGGGNGAQYGYSVMVV